MDTDREEYIYHFAYKSSRRQAEVFLATEVKTGKTGTINKKRDDLYEIVTRELKISPKNDNTITEIRGNFEYTEIHKDSYFNSEDPD